MEEDIAAVFACFLVQVPNRQGLLYVSIDECFCESGVFLKQGVSIKDHEVTHSKAPCHAFIGVLERRHEFAECGVGVNTQKLQGFP